MNAVSSVRSSVLYFLAVSLASFMVGVDFLAIGVAVDPMARDLHIGISTVQWLLTAFAIGESCFLVAAGKLSDALGPKAVLLLGVVFFILSSLIIACSTLAWAVIFGRFLQGVSAGFMVTASLASVMKHIPEKKRSAWIAMIVGMAALGNVLGPMVGGYLIDQLSWRWVFLINLPIGLVALIIICYIIPKEPASEKKRRKVDVTGIALLALSLLCLNLQLSHAHIWGWVSPTAFLFYGLFILSVLLFVFQELRFENPIVRFSMFKVTNFLPANLIGFSIYFALISWVMLYGVYLQQVMALTPLQSGEWLLPFGLMTALVSPWAGKITARLTHKFTISLGLFLNAFALSIMALLPMIPAHFWLAVSFMIFGAGFVLVNSTSIPFAMMYLNKEQMGVATGKCMMIRWLGAAMGTSIVTMVFVHVGLVFIKTHIVDFPAIHSAHSVSVISMWLTDLHHSTSTLSIEEKNEYMTVFKLAMHSGLNAALWVLASIQFIALFYSVFTLHEKKA